MNRELALRLADATPLILADLACLAMVVFLTTRLWVAAAPALGRRAGRWTLATALPLGLLASVAVHAWAPQKASELSAALDATAFLVAIPLGLWWLGALLVRVIRRLLRRPPAAVLAPRASDWLRMGVATLPVVGLAIGIQWALCHEETKTLAARSRNLAMRLRALEAVANKAEEFFREDASLAANLEGLRRIVPRAPEIEGFVADVTALARDQRIALLDWTAGGGSAVGALQEHSLTFEMGGELRNLRELALRSRKLTRLSVWRQGRVRDGKAQVQLTVYSAPDKAVKDYDSGCAHPSSDVWLWPYSARVADARAHVDRLCAEIVRLVVVQRQVERFQAAKAQLQELLAAIESLRANRDEFRVIEEPEQRRHDRRVMAPSRKET